MVRRAIDRRRRSLLQTVGLGIATTTCGTASLVTSSAQRRGVGRMSRATAVLAPQYVVVRGDSETRVLQRGSTDPVFSGPAAAALQYAIDAGEEAGWGTTVAVGPGTLELERTVRLASATWLAGGGVATTIRPADGFDGDLLSVPAGSEHVRISDLRLAGSDRAPNGGDAVAVTGYSWRTVLEHLVIREMGGDGIRFRPGTDGDYSYEPVLADIDVARCGGDGFVFGSVGDLFGSNLYAENCAGCGFTMAGAGSTIVHPHAYDNRGEAGVRVLESAVDLDLFGGHFERNRRHGALVKGERVAIRNAFVADNSRDASGSYSGIVLDGARDSLVSESTFVNDTGGQRTQRHGLVETEPAETNRVTANLFRNHDGIAVERAAGVSTSVYRDNVGYTTANGGTATVRDGGEIPHGLDEVPTQYWVQSRGAGTLAHVVDVDSAAISVTVVDVGGWSSVSEPVEVSWGAMSDTGA